MHYYESIDQSSADAEEQLKIIVRLNKSLDDLIKDYLNADLSKISVALGELETTKNRLQELIKKYNNTYNGIPDTSEVKYTNATTQKVARIKEAQAAQAAAQAAAKAAAKAAGNGYQDVLRL